MLKVIRRGGIAEIGATPFAVYMVLRNYVWRSKSRGYRPLQKEFERGNLSAVVRQEKIARLIGVTTKTAQRSISKLKRAKWIEVIEEPGYAPVYVLGRRVGKIETFFADELGTFESPGGGDISRSKEGTFEADEGASNVHPSIEDQQRNNNEGTKTGKARRIRRVKRSKTRSDPTSSERITKTPQPPSRSGWSELPDDPTPANGKPTMLEDPKLPGRLVPAAELRQLQSARAKLAAGRKGEYSSAEIVAVWRDAFYRAFGGEDPDLVTEAQRKRAAQMITRRATDWANGDKSLIRRYLKAMILLWRDRPRGARFPAGAAPRLDSLLKKDKRGPSTFWRDWDLGRRKRRRDG